MTVHAYFVVHIGNRETSSEAGTQSTYSTNHLNQYTELLGEAVSNRFVPEHDTDGNATLVHTSTGTRHITYNAENRPIRFENTETQTVVDCGYDSQGLRAEYKSVTNRMQNTRRRFLCDGNLYALPWKNKKNKVNNCFRFFSLSFLVCWR